MNRIKRIRSAISLALVMMIPCWQAGILPVQARDNADGEKTSAPVEDLRIKNPLINISRDVTLENGLRVIVSEDHSTPVASMVIVYDVGARDEKKGKSGFAHLFEHMMFEGSDNVPKGEFFKHIQSAGGSLNASTHEGYTDYYIKVPSNQIELAFWLESDRMRSLKVTEENFKNQLETVKEEKRLRIDNKPYVPAELELEELIFDNWSNAHPVIGYYEDLEASSVEDVKKFFDTYYVPNNAVLAVVGDVDSDQIEALAKKYFGGIAKGPDPERPKVEEPEQKSPKYLKVKDKHAKLPAFWLAWKAPARREKDSYVLNLLQGVLSMGPSSRLYRRLVKEDQIALTVSCSYEERRGPSNISFFVLTKPGNDPEKVKKVLMEEINKVKTDKVSDEELEKAKNHILKLLFSSGSYYSLQGSLGRAENIAQNAAFFGKPDLVNEDINTYLSLTADDLKRVANQVFSENGVTTVDVVPDSGKLVQ